MAQTFTDDWYAQGYNAHTAFGNAETNDTTLKSSFSGASAPSNTVAGQVWFDTDTGAMKQRNAANDGWEAILRGDASQKMWIYRDDTCDGWTVDATVTDVVLALKGGAQAYYVNGGNTGGTWTQPSYSLTAANLPAHDHGSAGNHNHDFNISQVWQYSSSGTSHNNRLGTGAAPNLLTIASAGAHTHASVGSGTAHSHGTTYRPAAAIGTLQYPDLA